MTENDHQDEIQWTEAGAPRSRRYDDVFFSEVDGLAESRHVFQGGVGLGETLAAGGRIRIGEIGFGVGLNFLAAWAALDQARGSAPERGARIDYAGFEIRPPGADEIRKALAPWPELEERREALLAEWPPQSGVCRRLGEAIDLTVQVGSALQRIGRLAEPRAIWWLDGFSPAKNPEAWAPELLAAIYERTEPGGRLATYAAAGWVRRGLQQAGFTVTRAAGFGAKREMLTARRPD